MRQRRLVFLSLLLCGLTFTQSLFAAWKEDLQRLLALDDGRPQQRERQRLVTAIAKAAPPFEELVEALRQPSFAAHESPRHLLLHHIGLDGVKRPYCLYVPQDYSPARSHPLLVWLHGGVTRKELIDDPLKYAEQGAMLELCKRRGWFLLTPFGQAGAAWWERVGRANVMAQIRKTKASYNIDDGRVWLGGFSDGASAAFCFAMTTPSTFAGFLALNGHMGVGSLDGDLPTYANNMANTPVYAVTTKDDPLYPTAKMAPTIAMAQGAGAQIEYRQLAGTHSFDYAASEMPRIEKFLDRCQRRALPSFIDWEVGQLTFARCHWLELTQLRPAARAKWHEEANCVLRTDRITIGFHEDGAFKGKGDRVASLAKGDTLARRIGLEEGDVIIRGGTMAIEKPADLAAYKATLRRGGPIELTVQRAGQEEPVELAGTIPPEAFYYLFKRQRPSARVRVRNLGDRFEIRSSGAGRLRLLLDERLVIPGTMVTIVVDGREPRVVEAAVDVAFMLEQFLASHDRQVLYYGYLDVEL